MGENVNEILPGLDLQNLIQFLLAFFLTSIRLSAFLIAAPLFNAAFFMVRIRILIAMVVSVIVFRLHSRLSKRLCRQQRHK